ncbi:MAG: segregation/condensation protein A [Candidatus Paceibacterales bacterium]
MNSYQLKLENYQGPLEKLLELIEEKKMEITEINLAEVTTDFLSYLQELTSKEKIDSFDGINLRIIADFVAVASRLVLIKSKALLPGEKLTLEEESEIKELEERLKIYKEFRPVPISLGRKYYLNQER